jgi:hypothetical protein
LVAGTHLDRAKANDTRPDLGPMDFSHAVDNLQACLSAQASMNVLCGPEMCQCKAVVAVRVNCEGDREIHNREAFQLVSEHAHYLAGNSEIATPVADKIGLPLIVRKIAPAVEFPTSPTQMINKHVFSLNPSHQAKDTGSLLVARKDGKPLFPLHVFALVLYAAERMSDPVDAKTKNLDVDDFVHHGLQRVSRVDFEER